jgi:TolB-like protein
MERPSSPPPPPRSSRRADKPSRATVVAELSRIEQSPAFGGSARQMRLLRFLVAEALEGRGGELRASVVATRVFERPEGFDSSVDSIVRVEMSKLRRALDRHYASTGAGPVRVELPRGSYVPTFVSGPAVEAPSPPTSERPAVGADGPVLAVLPFIGQTAVSTAAIRASGPGEPPPVQVSAPGARGRALAHGLTDRLGALFTRAPGVLVLSRATTLEEAQAQGARYVLEGTVRLLPGALRVTAKLHDTARGLQVWGNTYDRFGADDRLFAVEDEIADEMTLQVLALPWTRAGAETPGG